MLTLACQAAPFGPPVMLVPTNLKIMVIIFLGMKVKQSMPNGVMAGKCLPKNNGKNWCKIRKPFGQRGMVYMADCLRHSMAIVSSFLPLATAAGTFSSTLAVTAVIGRVRSTRAARTSQGTSTSVQATPLRIVAAVAAASADLSEQCARTKLYSVIGKTCRLLLCEF